MTCNSSVQTFEKCLIKSKCIGFEMQFAVLNKKFHISLVWIILFIFTYLEKESNTLLLCIVLKQCTD